ncbi:hypothetical protein SBI67_14835 [Mycolicibacterium sp. 120266]|uniref:hypothetical protein n=1 Tax=Mycolicibacterium sp. 120266 TaxID=3090601 RepID=UPI00299CDD2F|nr:hypothetical protein [Mycolicibacterium sp. 120266]MDX1873395.1 hypothetical protein [Mycolicibacterium sp. 120266]
MRGHPGDPNSAVVWFSDRLEWSRRLTVRIIFFSGEEQILNALVEMGCCYERLRQIVAVDIPAGSVVDHVHAFLSDKQASGELDLEEACLPDRLLH